MDMAVGTGGNLTPTYTTGGSGGSAMYNSVVLGEMGDAIKNAQPPLSNAQIADFISYADPPMTKDQVTQMLENAGVPTDKVADMMVLAYLDGEISMGNLTQPVTQQAINDACANAEPPIDPNTLSSDILNQVNSPDFPPASTTNFDAGHIFATCFSDGLQAPGGLISDLLSKIVSLPGTTVFAPAGSPSLPVPNTGNPTVPSNPWFAPSFMAALINVMMAISTINTDIQFMEAQTGIHLRSAIMELTKTSADLDKQIAAKAAALDTNEAMSDFTNAALSFAQGASSAMNTGEAEEEVDGKINSAQQNVDRLAEEDGLNTVKPAGIEEVDPSPPLIEDENTGRNTMTPAAPGTYYCDKNGTKLTEKQLDVIANTGPPTPPVYIRPEGALETNVNEDGSKSFPPPPKEEVYCDKFGTKLTDKQLNDIANSDPQQPVYTCPAGKDGNGLNLGNERIAAYQSATANLTNLKSTREWDINAKVQQLNQQSQTRWDGIKGVASGCFAMIKADIETAKGALQALKTMTEGWIKALENYQQTTSTQQSDAASMIASTLQMLDKSIDAMIQAAHMS